MAKKSQKRPVRHERSQSGCMWGIISMFDFRHGRSTQKLLSDRRRGTRPIIAAGIVADNPELLIALDENFQGSDGGEENKIATSDAGKPSVKKLMEDEMYCHKDLKKEINSCEVEPKQSNSEHDGQKRKNKKRTNRSRTKSCEIFIEDVDTIENTESEKACLQCSEKQLTNNIDMNVMLEEFCHQIHHIGCLKQDRHGEVRHQPSQKNPEFEAKLKEAIKLFIRQRHINGKHDRGDGDIQPSKELREALKNLSSDEELSLKLLQGPKSVMVKYVEDLWNAQVEKDEADKEIHGLKQTDEVVHSKQHKFFRRRAKSLEKLPSKGNNAFEAPNRIVILKPGPAGAGKPDIEGSVGPSPESQPQLRNRGPDERAGSFFFFSEIKRRLKQAMGKEQQDTAPAGISERITNKHRARADAEKRFKENVGINSPSKDHFFIEKIARPSVGVKKEEKTDKMKEGEIRVSNLYVEAKKHLSEMLTGGSGDLNFSGRQVPKTLGRILSLPEYSSSPLDSPRRDLGSPGSDCGQSTVNAQMQLSNDDRLQKQENNVSHLGQTTQNSETELCVSDDSTNDQKESSLNQISSVLNELVQEVEVEKVLCSAGVEIPDEGNVEIVKADEIEILEEDILDTLFEPAASSVIIDDQNDDSYEVHDVKDSLLDVQKLSSLSTSPYSSSSPKKNDDLECAADRPSPVSVLDPLFTEEDISPASIRFQPVENSLQPLRIQFEEHSPAAADLGTHLKACVEDKESVFEYIKVVLEASEVNWDEFYIMSNSSDPLLDPSIFDEVGFFPNQLCCDKKLLFDCVNEVLMEVYGRYFGYPLGLSFGKPNVRPAPDMNVAIHEVWEGVYWYLLPLPPPRTLEQIVKKDMAKAGSWMDLRSDGENMVIEIGEFILKDLVEETLFVNCVSESLESENHSTPEELKDERSIVCE